MPYQDTAESCASQNGTDIQKINICIIKKPNFIEMYLNANVIIITVNIIIITI